MDSPWTTNRFMHIIYLNGKSCRCRWSSGLGNRMLHSSASGAPVQILACGPFLLPAWTKANFIGRICRFCKNTPPLLKLAILFELHTDLLILVTDWCHIKNKLWLVVFYVFLLWVIAIMLFVWLYYIICFDFWKYVLSDLMIMLSKQLL